MASEIRVNTFKNRSGLGTVSINDTGASFSGVVTATSGFSGDLTGNSIVVGDKFINSSGVGIGTTDTTGRNAGVGTAIGTLIYNTTVNTVQTWIGSQWANLYDPVKLNSITGSLLVGTETTLTLTGTNFGPVGNITVNFSGGSLNENITGQITVENTTGIVTTTSAVFDAVSSGDNITIRFTNSEGLESSSQSITAKTPPVGGATTTTYESGGTNYRSHTFTTSGSFVVSPTYPVTVDYLIVAGGGGAGRDQAGGGGAGGLIFEPGQTITAGSYTVTIGAGGASAIDSASAPSSGEDTTFLGLTALGGGPGSYGNTNSISKDGGSGGGGDGEGRNPSGGTGLQFSSTDGGYGNDGGDGANPGAAGGGGGAGSAGSNANGSNGGAGGDGLKEVTVSGTIYNFATIFGTNYGELISGEAWFAGGGGGADDPGNVSASGGKGGGGDATTSSTDPAGEDGAINTGGGGGGSWSSGLSGGSGGSGIVIIRYAI